MGERNRVAHEVLHDLARDVLDERLLDLKEGERLWKVYLFRPASGRATRLEHRIYTKRKTDGRLALVTFAVHTPAGGQTVRSKIMRVPDLMPEHLDRIIEAIRAQTHAGPGEYEDIDLSEVESLDEQLDLVREGGGQRTGKRG